MQVLMLPVDSIHIKSRQRTVDPSVERHIKVLAEEIERDGLLHAIAVDKNYELVAGWCRLNAIRLLTKPYKYSSADVATGFIPCVVVHQNTESDIFRVELMENLRRKNLSPMDEARAIARLHRVLEEAHGEDWTKADTGKELDKLRGETRSSNAPREEVGDSLLLDSFAEDKEVNAAGSRKEAVKIARKKLEQDLMSSLGNLAVLVNKDYSILEGDCRTVMPGFEADTFHGIIVDPPYGIGADDFGDQTMAGGHEYEDTRELAFSILEAVFAHGARICKPDAHIYTFCDQRYFEMLSMLAETSGWSVFPSPLIWHKPNAGHCPIPGLFLRRYECILFAYRGNRKLAKNRSDIFEYPTVSKKIHAAQKPVELLKELCSLSFFLGEHILDPCAGSGSLFEAGGACKLKVTGIEKEAKYAAICKQVIASIGKV